MAGGLYRSLYDFKAETEKDLSLQSGDLVKVTKKINEDWYEGVTECRCGQFPANYVQKVLDNVTNRVGVAISAFNSDQDGDLSFTIGDVIAITERIDDNWLLGFTAHNKGIFPVNHAKEILFYDGSAELNNNRTDYVCDFSQNDNNIQDKPSAVAIDNFVAQENDELTVKTGDEIILLRQIDSLWLEGTLNGKVGKFPLTFVRVVNELPDELKYFETTDDSEDLDPKAKARFMFVATNPEELSFDKGDIIILTERVSKEWLRGKIGNTVGMFPANHVEVIIDLPYTEPQVPCKEDQLSTDKHEEQPDGYKSPQDDNSPTRSPIKTKVIAKTVQSPRRHSFNKTRPPPPAHRPAPQRPTNNISNPPTVNRRSKPPVLKRTVVLPPKGETDVPPPLPKKQSSVQKPRVSPIKPGSFFYQKDDDVNSENVVDRQKQKNISVQNTTQVLTNGDIKTNDKPPASEEKTVNTSKVPLKRADTLPSRPKPPQSRASLKKNPAPLRPASVCVKKVDTNEEKTLNIETDLLSDSPPKRKNKNKLPKPLAPMPLVAEQNDRPSSLNLPDPIQLQQPAGTTPIEPEPSPIMFINPKDMSVSFSKEKEQPTLNSSLEASLDNTNRGLHRSETDPEILKMPNEPLKLPLTPQPDSNVRSMYFSTSTSAPMLASPEKRHLTLDAMLQRSTSLRGRKSLPGSRNLSEVNSPVSSCQGSTDNLSQQSNELKRIDTTISEIKSKIDGEVHLLSGVETLLDFVCDDKRGDLLVKQEHHNNNIVELNEELNALEDEKSFLLASLGQVGDVKNRVTELEKQIETYLDNCEQLRRMQDVAVVEDLPEIRDNIEFCENMVDTLQDELKDLREKLSEMGELDQIDSLPDPVVQYEKRKKNQLNVIEELLNTEKSYIESVTLLTQVMTRIQENTVPGVNVSILFSNLPDILELSTKLSENLQLAHDDEDQEDDERPGNLASCFIGLSSEMKEVYSTYCHNYEEAQSLLEKYMEDESIWNSINSIINQVCEENSSQPFILSSYLIKPVQRVLKYPLLLSELLKNHGEEGINREVIKYALNTVTDVATAINEFKRRKDLVQKYRETEDGIGKKVQKLNWHSVAKKSSRINQRITQFTGFNSQTVDEKFNDEEKRFRGLEKLIKLLLKNIEQFVEDFKANTSLEYQCSESVYNFYGEKTASESVMKYYADITTVTKQYAQQAMTFIKVHVTDPLKEVLALFHGPFRLIQKRNDKCLDYDRAKNKATRAKDSKEKEKISQTQEELQHAENVYSALNTQLLEDLPSLCTKASEFVKYCLGNFVEAFKRYLSKAFNLLQELHELPLIVKDVDMYTRHNDLLQRALFQLSTLSFIPANSNKDNQRRSQTQVINTALIKASFFLDVSSNSTDDASLSKPLIDLCSDALDTTDRPPSREKSLDYTRDTISESTPSIMDDTVDDESMYTVAYNFVAESTAEITVTEGTLVKVLRKSDKNGNTEWWHIEADGEQGYIPESFLTKAKATLKRSKSDGHTIEKQLLMPDRIMGSLDAPPLIDTDILQPVLTSELKQTSQVTNDNSSSSSIFYTHENNNTNNLESSSTSNFFVDTLSKDNDSSENLTEPNSVDKNDDHAPTPEASLTSTDQNTSSQKSEPCYIIEYEFEALNTGELSVKEGQVVNVLRKNDQKGNPEWWLVEFDGQQGYVPRDFITWSAKS